MNVDACYALDAAANHVFNNVVADACYVAVDGANCFPAVLQGFNVADHRGVLGVQWKTVDMDNFIGLALLFDG